jgi:hypothetical protein
MPYCVTIICYPACMRAGDCGAEAWLAAGGSGGQPEQRQEQRAGGSGEQLHCFLCSCTSLCISKGCSSTGQVAVVGSQSSGKSSVLEALVSISLCCGTRCSLTCSGSNRVFQHQAGQVRLSTQSGRH